MGGVPSGAPAPFYRRAVNALCARGPALLEARLLNAAHRCVTRRMGPAGVPGVQISLCVDGRPVRTMAWGHADAPSRTPMRESTRFRLASLAKPVSSLVFLRLVARGTFTLDEPLNGLLAGVAPQVCGAPLSARQLLAHRAGLAELHPPHFPLGASHASLAEAIRGGAGTPAVSRDPALCATVYTGAGWMLLEHAIEQRTGVGFRDLADGLVLRALGLGAMTYHESARCADGVSSEHFPDRTSLPITTSPAPAATGLVSDTRDYVLATRAQLDAARGERVEFLPAALARESVTPQPAGAADAGFTLSHFVYSRSPFTLTHGGFRPGIRATVTVFPRQRIIAVFAANSDNGFEAVKPWLGLLGSMATARGGT